MRIENNPDQVLTHRYAAIIIALKIAAEYYQYWRVPGKMLATFSRLGCSP